MTICFVVHENNRGTILDRIAHEIGKGFEDAIYCYDQNNVPKVDHYFITHYSMLPNVLKQVNPGITPVTCFFTHDKGGLVNYVEAFNLCHAVVAESPEGEELLISLGVNPNLVHFVAEGGDNERFKPHQRKDDGAVLISSRNYEDGRKNPELIKKVIDLLPHRKFYFLGDGWDKSLEPRENIIHHHKIPYENYYGIYGACSVFLSCAKLEGGGPNSLIESMHANLIPVVSDTGNARQYIQHGYNGFIFPVDSTPEYVASLIERAYKFRPQDQLPFNDVWRTVTQYTWPNFAKQMKEIITANYAETLSSGEYKFKPEVV